MRLASPASGSFFFCITARSKLIALSCWPSSAYVCAKSVIFCIRVASGSPEVLRSSSISNAFSRLLLGFTVLLSGLSFSAWNSCVPFLPARVRRSFRT